MKILNLLLFAALFASSAVAQNLDKTVLPKSRLTLSRRAQANSFYDVVGHKSAAFGYENRAMEAWVYPLKIVDDFELEFEIDGYKLPFRGRELLTSVEARPEATIFTYSHAAFSVRQMVYAPVDEPAIISLLDIKTTLPMIVHVNFRPKLRPMWAAGLMTPFYGQDKNEKFYFIGEESKKYVAIIGTPGAEDESLMPYQEEPKDVPVRYKVRVTPSEAAKAYVPIVMTAGIEGRDKAVESYKRVLANALPLYRKNVEYYESLLDRTTSVTTPDERLNQAYAWAKIGIDKGLATNPSLGTGLVAGFRTSGDSERPGFAWYFGRDALWTAFATTAEGDYETTKTAIRFLRKFQRADGKIPHEISQSAAQLDWFNGYPYPWNSADATPLFIIAIGDYYAHSLDRDFVRENWASIKKAFEFTAATDTDGNGLIENTKFGHGWVEGGALYPPHEEIYMQGVWIKACDFVYTMGRDIEDSSLSERAVAFQSKTREAMESKFWLADRGMYAYATQLPRDKPIEAEPGPNLERRQKRLNELQKATLYDEDTVLPAVPMWWRGMYDSNRAQLEIDHLGSAKIATDWGARIIANDSQLYDPLSYHYGSVWGLFTGWQSVAAYNYGRPHVGFQALSANSLLTYTNALGYVTELLSGDFNTPFGRSSHHQVWSEAMVVSPFLKGMLALEGPGHMIQFGPQLPANWNRVEVKTVRRRNRVYDFEYERRPGKITIVAGLREGGNDGTTLRPAFPLDAKILSATRNGKPVKFMTFQSGDVMICEIPIDSLAARDVFEINYIEGSDVSVEIPSLVAGAESTGIRIIRSHAGADGLKLVLEGRAGMTYDLTLHSPRNPKPVNGVEFGPADGSKRKMRVKFEGPGSEYVKREILIPFETAPNSK